MCDTLVALSPVVVGRKVLFAKSSDREPNEAHELMIVPAADYESGQQVKCTYISIPQVRHTFQTLLAKPYNIWGAEMGVNEHGVAIGNEAVFTRMPYEKGPGLTGMDLLRLALERSQTAQQALDIITSLLEKYGQGGNCGYRNPMYYHNSFLIADFRSAWILETAGKQWAARQVHEVGSISNALTIGEVWDHSSAGLITEAEKHGWVKRGQRFNFAASYSDLIFTTFADGKRRQACTSSSLRSMKAIDTRDFMAFLRQHPTAKDGKWRPDQAISGADVCMHAGYGPIRIDQTVGSMVVELVEEKVTVWATGTSAPCLSIFKPFWLDAMPDLARPGEKYDPKTIWWRHERLHRAIIQDYPARAAIYHEQMAGIEEKFLRGARELYDAPVQERRKFSEDCLRQVEANEDEVFAKISEMPIRRKNRFYYRMAWDGFNRDAGILV